jgi:histidinol-phosphate aminotransferase
MSVITRLARPEILALEPYAHASWEPALERLHANENPWRDDADHSTAGLNRYPEPEPSAVEARLAALYGVDARQLLAGRGSDEGIDLLTRAVLVPGRDVALICPPTFGMYALATRIQGGTVVEVPLDRAAGFALDEAMLLARVTDEVKLVFLCTPNNPTGNPLPAASIERIAARLEGRALVVVDEAYLEFGDAPSLIARIGSLPNLVVLRTLSKAYALAGARCGAVVADAALIELLKRIRPPYSMSTPTTEAVLAALEAPALARARGRIERVKAERGRLAAQLSTLPLVRRVWPSAANFLLVECRDAVTVLARARAAGFLLRDLSRGALTPDAVRISVGTPEQNDRVLTGLAAP